MTRKLNTRVRDEAPAEKRPPADRPHQVDGTWSLKGINRGKRRY